MHLQDEVKEVRLSSRLTSSPACLVADEHDLTPRMQKMLEQLGQTPPPVKPILELNPNHPLIAKLKAVFAPNKADPRLAAYARLLLGQAYLADTGQVPDPAAFGQALDEVMLGRRIGRAAPARLRRDHGRGVTAGQQPGLTSVHDQTPSHLL